MTTLIIARHGNTFGPEDTPTRVGARTDLPLVEKGIEQAKALGRYLNENRMIPDVVYSSDLQRTYETAKIAIKESGVTNPIYQLDIFNEIDYGPDENKPEDEVIARIGEQAIQDWDQKAIVPDGWRVDPQAIIQNWIDFADQICAPSLLASPRKRGSHQLWDEIPDQVRDAATGDETVLVVTSNGIARFAPHITGDFEGFAAEHNIKLSTGAFGVLKHDGKGWHVDAWNVKP